MPVYDELDVLPDVRDGLNRRERIVLTCLNELQRELGVGHVNASRSSKTLTRANVPTIMLYGRVIEHVDMSKDELQEILSRWAGVSGG